MEDDLDDATLQNIAMEMNLSETAFVWRQDEDFQLRWFAPKMEVDLCGHATLATSHALKEAGWATADEITFHTKSGPLKAGFQNNRITLDFPSKPQSESPAPENLLESLGVSPTYVGKNGFDHFVVVESQAMVESAKPIFDLLKRVKTRGVILTAVSSDPQFDFVSRFFCPLIGVDEDPVTGSAHVCLAPYWQSILGKDEMVGYQASERGGVVHTKINGERVELTGDAVTVIEGTLRI